MLLLELNNLKYEIENRLLLDLHRLHVQNGERIGLIGKNGSGKSTLLDIIANEIVIEKGSVVQHTSLEYVRQFKPNERNKSGGEITLEHIQRAIKKQTGLLLLDEPTTNLDVERIGWLEKQLDSWQGAFIIVSHDRSFLDQLCSTIWEIDASTVTVYKGNYSAYVKQKKIEEIEQVTEFNKYEKEKAQLEKAVQKIEERAQRATRKPKHLSASDARILGAKTKYQNKQRKLRKTVTAVESRIGKLEHVRKPNDYPEIKMDIVNGENIKNQVIIRGEALGGQIRNRILWKPADFYLRSGEKIALIGSNGVGKTTLIKKILHADTGIQISPAVKIGYFAQNLEVLNEEQTVLENIQSTSKQTETLIRIVLARMDIMDEAVYKKVNVLSGGEKVKVALSKIFLSDVNVLILDEPTNFLDVYSLEALESLLVIYEGTVIFVSHDRKFVRNIATEVIAIEDKQVIHFTGTYKDYLEHKEMQEQDSNYDALLLVETQITDVLSRLSIEPSLELEEEFNRLIKLKKQLTE